MKLKKLLNVFDEDFANQEDMFCESCNSKMTGFVIHDTCAHCRGESIDDENY